MTVPKINSAHGSDTRNIINRAIEVLNRLGIDVQTLVANGQLTPAQYAELLTTINGLIKSGEVSIYDINKNKGKFDQTYMSEELLQQIAGKTSINAVPADKSLTRKKYADKSVTPEKTSFIKRSSNLFNKANAMSGALNPTTGILTAHNTYWSSDFIPADPEKDYTYDRFNRILFYDEAKNHLTTNQSTNRPSTFRSPEGTAFMRLSVEWIAYLEEAFVTEGSVFNGYEPYYLKLSNEFNIELESKSITNEYLANDSITTEILENDSVTIEKAKFIEKSTNLFDKSKVTKGYYADGATGQLVANGQYSVSDFIKVESNENYISKFTSRIVRYDANKNYISSHATGSEPWTSSSAEYIRVNFFTKDVDSVQLNKGDTLLPYEHYYLRLSQEIKVNDESDKANQKSYYFVPQEIVGYYVPTDSIQFNEATSTINVADYYEKWDELMIAYPDFISKSQLGLDQSGAYPINEYSLKPERLPAYWIDNGADKKTIPKLLLVSGVHGEEKASFLSLYYLIKDICENWHTNPILEYLRWNVEIKIIPLVNPWGVENGNGQVNSRGVNINRNFELNWDDYTHVQPGEQLYGGTAPFSEIESQIVKSWVDNNLDAIYYGDYHTNGTSGSEYDNLLWHPNPGGAYQSPILDMSSRQIIELMTRKMIKGYDMPNNQGFFGYINYSNPPRTASYAAQKGMPSHTFECYRKLPHHSEYYNPTALKGCTEYLGNWLGVLCKGFKDAY